MISHHRLAQEPDLSLCLDLWSVNCIMVKAHGGGQKHEFTWDPGRDRVQFILPAFYTGPWHRVQLFDLLLHGTLAQGPVIQPAFYTGPWQRVQLFNLLFVSLTHSLTH